MEAMICNSCGAKLVPTNLTPFLTCAYCDTSIPNPHYDAAAATAAEEKPGLAEFCLSVLKEMGTAQNLIALDRSCFGDPINSIDAARAGLAIPDDQHVYFLYEHTFLFIAFSDGLALTDKGLYYCSDDGKGSLSWEAFITAPISCVDQLDGQDGTLKIGSSIDLPVRNETDSRLVRFLVDFHNHVYQQHTGSAAPAAWAVTEPVISAPGASVPQGSVLPGIGALLGSAILGTGNPQRTRTILHTPTVHHASQPTIRKDRREHVAPPRPLSIPPHRRPAGRPGSSRPMGSRPAAGRPGHDMHPGFSQPNRAEALRKPAAPARPGSIDTKRKPAASARPGSIDTKRKPGGRR